MKKLTAIILTVVLVISIPLTALAWNCDEKQLFLESTNAPEGTLYVDLLVKMDNTHEHWKDFTQSPKKKFREEDGDWNYEGIDIGEDSDIAKYDTDGFVSFAFHNDLCKQLYFEDDTVYMLLECNAEDVFDNYTIKAAYVDESGKILDVTDIALSDQAMYTPYTLRANGHNATLISVGIPDETAKQVGKIAVVVTIVVSLLLVAIFLLVVFIIKKILRKVRRQKNDI